MQGKPLLTIDKFSGSGEGGLFYNEGFMPDRENGQSVLREAFVSTNNFDNSDSGYSSPAVSEVKSMMYIQSLSGTSVYLFVIDKLGQFYLKNIVGTTFTNGYVFITPTTGNYAPVQKPDMYQLPSGNIIYTTNISTGIIYRGKVKTGSSATTIIDTDGRDWTALGVTTANTVTNLVTGKRYPITSITTTTATNDTLNFTTQSSSNTANDEFMVLVHQKFDLTSGVTYPTFIGQPLQIYWSRQIKQYGDVFYILNGNYLAKLASDEITFEAGFKQLSKGYQATCFDTNTDRILIAARSVSQGFRLFLWDGYSDGFNNIIRVDSEINCLCNYRNGWVYMVNGVLYFTDGYQIQKLQAYADKTFIDETYAVQPTNFNGIVTIDDNVFTFNSNSNLNRALNAVYAWNRNTGWSIIPIRFKGRLYGAVTALAVKAFATSSSSNYPPTITVGLNGGVSYINDNNAYSSQYLNKSAIFFIRLPQKFQIKAIELNISPSYTLAGNLATYTQTKVSVNIGEGKGNVFAEHSATTVPTTTTIAVAGNTRTGTVGDEIQFVPGGTSEALNGERTFITSIANKGLSNEVWTVSPALSAAVAAADHRMRIIKVRSTTPTSKTVALADFAEPIVFNVDKGFVSDKLFLEIVVTGITSPCPITINSIKVY